MRQMMAITVLFMLMGIKYAVVEGTFRLYSQPLNSYHSSSLKSPFSWIGSSAISSFPSSYSSIYDTLNSEYSHALYPFSSDYVARIPVKGGLHVVPPPKNLHLLNRIHSYDHHSLYQNFPTSKTLSLANLVGSVNHHQNLFKGSSSPSYYFPRANKHSISSLSNIGGLDLDINSYGRITNEYNSVKNLHSLVDSAKDVSYNIKPSLESYDEHTSSVISTHSDPVLDKHEFKSDLDLSVSLQPSSNGHLLRESHHDEYHNQPVSAISNHDLPHESDYSEFEVQQERNPNIYSNQGISSEHHQNNKIHNSLKIEHPVIQKENIHQIGELQQKKLVHGENLRQTHVSHLPDTGKVSIDELSKTAHNKDYVAQKEIQDDSRYLKNDNYDKKAVTISRIQGEYKQFPNPPSYIHRRKPETKIHFHKGTNSAFQAKKYENSYQQNKAHEKPLEQYHEEYPTKEVSQYPEFPQQTKSSEAPKEINYAGGRYPIRTVHQHHDQNLYTSERPLVDRNHGQTIPVNSRKIYEHDEQVKINEEDTSYDLKNKQTGYENAGNHQVNYGTNYGRPDSNHSYKQKAVPPRGRSKQYRNYEDPRSSSYEIEILHSESSGQSKQTLDDGNLEVADSLETLDKQEPFDDEPEEFENDETDSFETQESRENISEEKPKSEFELVSEDEL